MARTKKATPTSASHSIRCEDTLWAKAGRRAAFEGTNLNRVMIELLEGYAEGHINPPRIIKRYDTPTEK